MKKQKVEIEDLWRLDKRITEVSKRLREFEKALSITNKDKIDSSSFNKEFKRITKLVDNYYSLASCKYVMRNGRELNVYEVLLTLLDRLDRGEYGEFKIKRDSQKG